MSANLRTRGLVLVVLVAFAMTGCEGLGGRPWGVCALGGGLIGAGIGGAVGGLVENNKSRRASSDSRTAASVAAGVATGAVLGAFAGHFLCDPAIEEAPPPPPPPPPLAAAPPLFIPPPPPPAPKPGTKIATLRGPNFDFNRTEIRPDGRALLDDAVRTMRENPNLRVSVEGHTDWIGSETYNQQLSEKRARAARDYLTSRGIEGSRIETRGFGESSPVERNDTEDGRAQNRRVEVIAQ